MFKLWQWIKDRKSATVRKWRSSVLFGSRSRVDSNFDPFEDGNLFSDSNLNIERSPIGGSDSRLQRGPSRSKRAFKNLQRKLTPSKRERGPRLPPDDLKPTPDSNEMKQLLLDEDDVYASRTSLNTYQQPSPSLSVNSERSYRSDSAAALPPIGRSRGYSYSVRSPNSPDLNNPITPKTRRRLRFVIPQVSLSTDDNPNGETTLLVGSNSQDSLDDFEERIDPPNDPRPQSSPNFTRRGFGDSERRRSSAQRKQSTTQLVQSVSGRRTSTTLIPLTVAQIHLVKSLWKQVYTTKGPTVIGETVMHRLFFKYPKLREQFRRCALPEGFNNHDSFGKSHYKVVGELVDQIVESLDNLEAVGEELERIGRIHATILNGQLSSKVWNYVAETFIDCTLEWGDRRCRSETVRRAWALIIAYMIEKLKHGHLDQRKQMLTMKSTIASLERLALSNTRS
ncbi:unnamed protein product [Bursaphelenchus xylophilus]|uniref:(pine wood nematode) hypothetical protein n=1 Tax=Bursaphelenchus xylophilus TaxID=6326 RepID=A0A1I7S950_BURXY|nr:unnamed protein product [Bursaphelenchus xylophilus]CAG9086268.1 unnamed protein product [Bursaphelenchus xylophilus]